LYFLVQFYSEDSGLKKLKVVVLEFLREGKIEEKDSENSENDNKDWNHF